MSNYREELKRRTLTAEQAAERVKSGDWIEYGFGIGQPDLFDRALAARVPALSDLKLRASLALRPIDSVVAAALRAMRSAAVSVVLVMVLLSAPALRLSEAVASARAAWCATMR